MPDQIGTIIRCPNKFAGPPTLAINTVGEGLRRHINLCFVCCRFTPDKPGHCDIAQSLFDICKARGVANALVRCAEFDAVPGVEVRDAAGPRVAPHKDAISVNTAPATSRSIRNLKTPAKGLPDDPTIPNR